MPQTTPILTQRLLAVLRQGSTPRRLAFTLALGFGLGCFPVFGTTTVLCIVFALLFRLNQPAIQVGNYLALPVQLALLIPFMRLGERIFKAPRLPLSPDKLVAMMRSSPDQTMHAFLGSQGHAIVAWMIVTPAMVLCLSLILTPLLGTAMRRSQSLRARRAAASV